MSNLGDLTDELCDLTRYWNAYEDVSKNEQAKCRDIGARLHNVGGFKAMTDAYYHAKASNRHAGVVQAYWNGVGDWVW